VSIDAKFARANSNIIRGSMGFQRGFSLLPGPRYTRTQPRRRESATVGVCELGAVSCPPAAAPPPRSARRSLDARASIPPRTPSVHGRRRDGRGPLPRPRLVHGLYVLVLESRSWSR
jgi:hypothetical protein